MPAAYAVHPRRPPMPRAATFPAGHFTATRHDILDAGDPFNPRNLVYPSDFYMQGKPWHDPGIHVNFYENARSTNSIMNRFFGTVSKLRYLRQPSRIVRGRQRALGGDVIVEAPPAVTYGDFATYRAGVIHTASRG